MVLDGYLARPAVRLGAAGAWIDGARHLGRAFGAEQEADIVLDQNLGAVADPARSGTCPRRPRLRPLSDQVLGAAGPGAPPAVARPRGSPRACSRSSVAPTRMPRPGRRSPPPRDGLPGARRLRRRTARDRRGAARSRDRPGPDDRGRAARRGPRRSCRDVRPAVTAPARRCGSSSAWGSPRRSICVTDNQAVGYDAVAARGVATPVGLLVRPARRPPSRAASVDALPSSRRGPDRAARAGRARTAPRRRSRPTASGRRPRAPPPFPPPSTMRSA